jgi:hypothetical protein
VQRVVGAIITYEVNRKSFDNSLLIIDIFNRNFVDHDGRRPGFSRAREARPQKVCFKHFAFRRCR